jgi:Fe-S-cluster-containing dehydrogenase component
VVLVGPISELVHVEYAKSNNLKRNNMGNNGLLIDYEYCTGCYTCEVACKQENGFPAGKGGVKLQKILTELPDKLRIDYIPFLTEYCNLCATRVSKGELPSCVKHCQAGCMTYGPVAKLAKTMISKPRSIMYAPR